MLFEIFVIVVLSRSIRCSLIIDAESQKGIYLSDYCPNMKYCPEGAHTMCMYYNPNSVMGPRCRNARNVSMTPELANKLLDVSNAVRSKLARGHEKGKNGDHLPRGYGIFRLKWDSELATFAQVLANQCVLRHDLCRATKKFPDPGQTAGLVRFSTPDWVPVSKSGNFSSRGLDNEKLLYATTQSLKSWYASKSFVNVSMVTSYPDWTKDPTNQNGRLYLEMIYGSATHMGCGISAYTEYAYYDNGAPLNYNSVQVMCNFSARPRQGAAVYNTVPPTDTESPFNACGCPAGSMEDDDCLCLEISREPEPAPVPPQQGQKCSAGINCDPTVVLMPIFTVEDAPSGRLLGLPQRSKNSSRSRLEEHISTIDSFEELLDNNVSGNKGIPTTTQSRKTLERQTRPTSPNYQKQRPIVVQSKAVTVRSRHFDSPTDTERQEELNRRREKQRQYQPPRQFKTRQRARSSVFSKTPIFELPTSHFLQTIKRDVVPRKDFSAGKQLVNKYIYTKNNVIRPKELHKFAQSHEAVLSDAKSVENVRLIDNSRLQPKDHKRNIDRHEELNFHDIMIVTTETNLNTIEQNVIDQNKDIAVPNLSQDYDKAGDNIKADENDKKFMALLNTLEQEVKHIELRDKEKQIFDAKIKKIYDKVVGKAANVQPDTEKIQVDDLKKLEDTDVRTKIDEEVRKLEPSFDAAADDEFNFIDQLNYQKDNVNSEVINNIETSKRDIAEAKSEEFERPTVIKQRLHLPYDKYKFRRRNNVRQNRNRGNSFESQRRRYDNEYKRRKGYKNGIRNEFGKLKHRSNTLDYKRNRNYYGNEGYEDPLSNERRKYYQDKLESMERKLQDVRHYNRRKETGRSPHMRAMKPNFRSDNQMNPLYTGRARILHGY